MGIGSLLEALLDIILPEKARGARTRRRSPADIPLLPTSHELLGVRITTLMEYQNPAVEDLIRSLKYDGSKHAAMLAAALLADYLREEIASHRTFSTRTIMLVPVPLHASRARERGWNQIERVLQSLPEEFRTGPISMIAPHALTRTRATKPQTKLPRSERLSNVLGAFSIGDESLVRGSHIFLIDDVTTTGATLANAATPLRRSGAEVTLIALARA